MDVDRSPTLVGVGASAGGVQALIRLVGGLDTRFSGAVLIVLHLPATAPSVLPGLLAKRCPVPVSEAVAGARPRPAHVYCARPGRHMTVRAGAIMLTDEPKVNRHRPSVDVLFRSLAADRGADAVGVVLSGTLDDGADGLAAIVRAGGTAIVQDPADADRDAMPRAALTRAPDARVLPADRIGPALLTIVTRRAGGRAPTADRHHIPRGPE